jgi:peptide/nickel transport system permease protein
MLKRRLGDVTRRIGQAILVIVGSTFLLSLLLRLLPVGLEEIYAGGFDESSRLARLKELRLDKDPITFYLLWLRDFVSGDFGPLVSPGGGVQPVSERVAIALPVSLQLIAYTQLVSLIVAIPLGIFTAYRSGRRSDRVLSYGLFTAASIPNFVFGLLMAVFFGVTLAILPPLGYVSPSVDPVEHVRSMILPVAALAIPLIATYTRLLRTDVIATLREDYVTMAVSKGLSNKRILFSHVLRPSSVTLFTSFALNMGALIGGTLVIEQVFTIPGLGSEIGSAIFARQFFALQSYVAIIAVGFIFFNTLADILVGFIDPRTRERRNA